MIANISIKGLTKMQIEQVPTFCVTLLKLMLTESAQPQAVQAGLFIIDYTVKPRFTANPNIPQPYPSPK